MCTDNHKFESSEPGGTGKALQRKRHLSGVLEKGESGQASRHHRERAFLAKGMMNMMGGTTTRKRATLEE